MALRVQTFRKEFLAARVRDLVADRALVAVAHAGNMGNVDKALVKATLSEAGAKVNYTRNKYAAKALEAAGLGELSPLLRGMTAIIAGPSEVETAKALHGLSKQLPDFFVLGAMLDSQRILQFGDVDRLAKLPPPDVVRSEMVMQMLPGSSLQVPNVGAYLVQVLQMRADSLRESAGGE